MNREEVIESLILIKDKAEEEALNLDSGTFEMGLKIGIQNGIYASVLKIREMNLEKVKVPPFVETYLSDGAFDNYSLADKVGYLVQSHSGDNYYLTDMLVEENFISETMGQMLFEYATNESIENLLGLINGHEVLEEKAEITITSPYRDDKKVTLNKDEAIEFVKEWFK